MGFNTLFYMKCGRKETYYNIIAIFWNAPWEGVCRTYLEIDYFQ